MKYVRHDLFAIAWDSKPITATVLNALENFLASLPAEKPYQRYGPFVNGERLPLDATFFNHIEDFLSQIQRDNPYQPWGPYINDAGPTVWRILDHIEEFLVTLNRTYKEETNEYGGITRTYIDPASSQQESKKCPICGGWKNFSDLWINLERGLCPGHEDLSDVPNNNHAGQDWRAFYQVGSPMPYGWYEHYTGEFRANPDYIAPPGRAEPAQYEQALVDYEQITKEGN